MQKPRHPMPTPYCSHHKAKGRRQRIPSNPDLLVNEQNQPASSASRKPTGSSRIRASQRRPRVLPEPRRRCKAPFAAVSGLLREAPEPVNPLLRRLVTSSPPARRPASHSRNHAANRGIPTESGVRGANPVNAPIASTAAQVSATSAAGRGANRSTARRPSACSSNAISVATVSPGGCRCSAGAPAAPRPPRLAAGPGSPPRPRRCRRYR